MNRIYSATFALLPLTLATTQVAASETRVKYVVPVPYMGTIDVVCAEDVVTAIRALGPIEDWSLGNGQDYRPKRSLADRRVIRLQPIVANPATTTFQFLANGQWFTLELGRARNGEKPISDLIFVPTEADIPDREPPTATLPSTRTPVQDYLSLVAKQTEVTRSSKFHWREQGQHLEVSIGAIRWSDENFVFRFKVNNHGRYPYPISRIAMMDLAENEYQTIAFPRQLESGDFHLEPGGSLIGALQVSGSAALRAGWIMRLRSSPVIPSADVIWRASDEISSKRGPIEDRLVVSVHAAGGATKLDDGVGMARKVWTSSQLVGAKVLYGAMKHVSIEGTLDFIRTNTASFQDATWDTQQGTLEASETSGRVQVGGLLHTAGTRWIPYTRVALGVQLSRRSTGMGMRIESDTRSALIFGLAGGLNVRLGKRMMAGAFVAYTDAMGDEIAQAFEAGVHLGASWDFGNDWD